jgi:hypothetical protein
MKTIFTIQIMIVCVFLSSDTIANVYPVGNTQDAGAGSLRQAILDANAHAGLDTIIFQILAAGNLFEGTAPNTFAVIQINTALPTITSPVFINGASQPNSNPGSTASVGVGVDNILLNSIPYPDIYLVPSASYVFPTNSSGTTGNGLTIDVADVTITGMAISGFGNTHTNGGTASGHGDIAVLRSYSPRTINLTITNCFLSCDPLGNFPTIVQRRSKSCSIMVAGNNNTGTISGNYIAHSGTYGIHFHGNVDNLGIGPAATVGSRNWTISGNQLVDVATNNTISAISRVSDGILLMKCAGFHVMNNYINNPEQMGIDMGYNADSNYICNNTITNFLKTTAYQLQAGVRIGLCSEADTLFKNVICNNPASTFKGGVWLDKSYLIQPGVTIKDNVNNLIRENRIYNNNGSGVVLSNYAGGPDGGCYNNTITRNSIYNNVGLGIDLDFSGLTGLPLVTVDDDGDLDIGPNNVQNFPIIDSVRRLSDTLIGFYGKAPAGSTMEFFFNDGEANKQGGLTLNYGEGKTYIGSAVEGSAADLRTGSGSFNVDGNLAFNSANLFFVVLPYKGVVSSTDSVTATATVGKNTSEFGPIVNIYAALDCSIISFSPLVRDKQIQLNWRAVCNNNFLYFDLEHSSDGKSFSRLQTVKANELNKISEYQYVHANAGVGKHYYRLRMMNTAGKATYSAIVFVDMKQNSVKDADNMGSFINNQTSLRVYSENKQPISLQLFDAQGKLVRHSQIEAIAGMNYIQFENVAQLTAGIYFVQLNKDGSTMTRKIIKQ